MVASWGGEKAHIGEEEGQVEEIESSPCMDGYVVCLSGGNVWYERTHKKQHTRQNKQPTYSSTCNADNVPEPVLTLMYHMQQFAARGVEQQHMPSRVGAASPAALLAGALIAQEEVKRRVKERVDQRRGRQTQ